MRLSAGQYGLRLTCGLGLLLLPAVQQKVCTWPAPRELKASRPPTPPPEPTSDKQPKSKPKNPLTLASTLPDVAPPRWPNHACLTAVQRERPLPVTSRVYGPRGSDDETLANVAGDALFGRGWPKRPPAQRLPTVGRADLRLVHAHRHVFQTSILETGPPRSQAAGAAPFVRSVVI
jgi:hypothetical protein